MAKMTMLQLESLVRGLVKARLKEVLVKEQDGGNTSIGQKSGYGAYGPGGPRSAGIQISGQAMMDEHDFLDDRPLANVVAMETRKAYAALKVKMGGKIKLAGANRLIDLLARKYPEYTDVVQDTVSDLYHGIE